MCQINLDGSLHSLAYIAVNRPMLHSFFGTIKFGSWRRIWKSWAPPRCKFFIWLVFHNRCWMADRLAKRGLPHPEACPFCDQAEKSIHHLLVGCVFTRQVWVMILQHLGLSNLAPGGAESRFSGWKKKSKARLYQKTCGRVSDTW
jgi:hypothetical protein